jgi:hypothetical protein
MGSFPGDEVVPCLVPFLSFVGQKGTYNVDSLCIPGFRVEMEVVDDSFPPGSELGLGFSIVGARFREFDWGLSRCLVFSAGSWQVDRHISGEDTGEFRHRFWWWWRRASRHMS